MRDALRDARCRALGEAEPIVGGCSTTKNAKSLDEFLEHGRAIAAERERAAAAGEAARLRPARARVGRRHDRLPQAAAGLARLPPQPRRGRSRRSRRASASSRCSDARRGRRRRVRRRRSGRLRAAGHRGRPMEGTGEIVDAAGARRDGRRRARSPTSIYEKEHPGTFELDEWRRVLPGPAAPNDGGRASRRPASAGEAGFFTSYDEGRPHASPSTATTIPIYAGNVVKAMASAKDGYRAGRRLVRRRDRRARCAAGRRSATAASASSTADSSTTSSSPRVVRVDRLTPTIVEVIVRAPLAARNFQPGQFYRLQNLRDVRADGRRHATDDGGHRADRRLGRSRSGACSR